MKRSLQCFKSFARAHTKSPRFVRNSRYFMAELLEERRLLAALYTPQYPGTVTNFGDYQFTGDIPIYLIYAGGSNSGFGYDGSVTSSQISDAVREILASSYLSGLSEYKASTQAHVNGEHLSTFGLSTV